MVNDRWGPWTTSERYQPLTSLAERRERRRWRMWWPRLRVAVLALAGAGAGGVIAWLNYDLIVGGALSPVAAARADPIDARFPICSAGRRVTCVVDGDTFWFHGEKIRIADIDTPEISSPRCDSELQRGLEAQRRLRELLNAGPFSLEPVARNRDGHGRLLRTVTRGGESLGDQLVREKLAMRWAGYKRGWC